jgi:hypothetical protein
MGRVCGGEVGGEGIREKRWKGTELYRGWVGWGGGGGVAPMFAPPIIKFVTI